MLISSEVVSNEVFSACDHITSDSIPVACSCLIGSSDNTFE